MVVKNILHNFFGFDYRLGSRAGVGDGKIFAEILLGLIWTRIIYSGVWDCKPIENKHILIRKFECQMSTGDGVLEKRNQG